MKCALALLGIFVVLSGCSAGNRELERGMELRSELLSAQQCVFDAEITADYGDRLNIFSVSCQGDAGGGLKFTVTAPESISGITGEISESGGRLTFDETALQFDTMTDDCVSPVSAPWIFLKTLRGGYLAAAGMEGELLHLTVHDSYAEDALCLDIWVDAKNKPVRAEILHENQRIITLTVKNFDLQ